MAGARGDDDIGGLIDEGGSLGFDEVDPVPVRGVQLATEHARHLAFVVHGHVDGEIDPHRPGHGQRLLVHRIALDAPLRRPRMGQDLGVVEETDRVDAAHTRTDRLAPAGVTGHQVGLDERDGDLQRRPRERRVHPDRHPHRGLAQVRQGVLCASGIVVDYPIIAGNMLAYQLDELVALIRPVQPGADEDGDGLAGDAGALEDRQYFRQDDVVRHRPGDVGDDDTGVPSAGSQLRERRRRDRRHQPRPDALAGVIDRGRRRHVENAGVIGQLDRETALAVVEVQLHRSRLPILPVSAAGTGGKPHRARRRPGRNRRRPGSR